MWNFKFTTRATKKLELILTQKAQKPILAGRRVRACVACESTREESFEVWAATNFGGRDRGG